MATSIHFKKKYKAKPKDMLIFDKLLYDRRDDYDSAEEAYHLLRYDYMKHSQIFLPANYARFRHNVTIFAKKILSGKRLKWVEND